MPFPANGFCMLIFGAHTSLNCESVNVPASLSSFLLIPSLTIVSLCLLFCGAGLPFASFSPSGAAQTAFLRGTSIADELVASVNGESFDRCCLFRNDWFRKSA